VGLSERVREEIDAIREEGGLVAKGRELLSEKSGAIGLAGSKAGLGKIEQAAHAADSLLVAGGGALSLASAGFAAKASLKDWRAGRKGRSLVEGLEAGIQSVVGVAALASAAGVGAAAPLLRIAGPLGSALGFAGAGLALAEAGDADIHGQHHFAGAERKVAAIKALGAGGSMLASLGAGAVLGTMVPVVGTAVGAAIGVGVGMFLESKANKASEKILATARAEGEAGLDAGGKLAARRAENSSMAGFEIQAPAARMDAGGKLAARRLAALPTAICAQPARPGMG
jgi:hypothetical protein